MPKPKYNTRQGGAVTFDKSQSLSNFEFQGVTARVFPLKADMAKLSNFCRRYLNTPKKIVEFRPALPYVYLAVLHYGKMSAPQARAWVSQNEMTFIIPLERYQQENDQMIPVDWAYVNPFIFVDDDISLTLGREVYGWPKVPARIEQDPDSWLARPRGPTQMMTLSTPGFLSVSLRQKEQPKRLLEISLEPTPTFSQLRPDYNPLSLLLNGPRTILEYYAMMYDWIELFAGLPIPGFSPSSAQQDRSDRQMLPRMMARGLRGLSDIWSDIGRDQIISALMPGLTYSSLREDFRRRNVLPKEEWENPDVSPLVLNEITLKQFRDAGESQDACYQALVQSQITIKNLKNGGLLGDLNLLQGDATGGFQILMHCHSQDPDVDIGARILDRLGLDVAKKRKGDERKGEGLTVSMLKPLYPFWTETELQYGDAKTICWRGNGQEWYRGPDSTDPRGPVLPEERLEGSPSPAKPPGTPARRPAYNTAGVGTLKVLEEKIKRRKRERDQPHEFFLSVYPLLADQPQLKKFCEDYLNDEQLRKDQKVSFETLGSYVYLIVTSLKDIKENSWAPREVAFSVPVKWLKNGEFADSALVSPFVFVETDMDAIIEREQNGRPVMDATLQTPGAGLPEVGSEVEYPLLTVKTEIVPQANQAQPASEQLLLEIYQGKFLALGELGVGGKRTNAEWQDKKTNYENKKREIRAKPGFPDHLAIAKVLALEILRKERPIKSLTLKQFRDADDPTDACYQAIVQSTWKIVDKKKSGQEVIPRWGAIPPLRYVKIYQRASQPIVECLGLVSKDDKTKDDKTGEEVTISYCEPDSPFWLRVEMVWGSQKNVYYRVGDNLSWQESHDEPPPLTYNRETLQFIQSDVNNFAQLQSKWGEAQGYDKTPLEYEDVTRAVGAIEEPHLVLESLLAKDWAQKS